MSASACVGLVAGATLVVLPTPTMTLTWTHTVEKTSWEEDYAASADGLAIVEARIEAVGAGMEPPASAVRNGRWWHYHPRLPKLSSVDLANSTFGGGYTVCWDKQCRPLDSIMPRGEQVSIVASDCSADGRRGPTKE